MAEQAPYRYPGATPFSTDQSHVFFGRKGDTEALLQKLRREHIILLHSKSGLGKSSLINAGVIPRSEGELKMVPVPIRFRAWVPGRGESPLSVTRNRLIQVLDGGGSILNGLVEGDKSLWQVAKSFQLSSSKRILILFDQFEELFTYPADDIEDFQQEIAELLNTGIPLRFRRKIDALDVEALSDEEEDILYGDLNAHILFAIRSDRLALLESLKKYLPNIMRHSYELKALTRIDAEDAIVKPANTPGKFATPPFTYSSEVVTQLLNYLEDPQECRVEGILLQMLCEHYERQFVEGQGLLHLDEIGDPGEIVQNYYREKIKTLPEGEMKLARLLIEDGLVSKGEGMRISLHEAYILQKYQVGQDLLTKLEDSRLVRREPFSRGGYTYELSHDRLVSAVVKMREERLEAEAKEVERQKRQRERREAVELREKLEKEEKVKARLQKRNQRIWLLLGVSLILLIVSVAFYFDLREQKSKLRGKVEEIRDKQDQLEISVNRNQKLQKEKQKIIDAFYFYDGRLALAVKDFYGEKRYGYIDKSGTAQIDYNYAYATPFDESGFAKVSRKIQVVEERTVMVKDSFSKKEVPIVESVPHDTLIDYLLDEYGNEYHVAYQKGNLASDIFALELIGREWTKIPSWIGRQKQLKVLLIDGVQGRRNLYSKLPSTLGDLTSLRHFSCSNGILRTLPSLVGKWKQLVTLDLSYNRLISLSDSLTNLTDIERFDLSHNKLTSLPQDIGNLSSLSEFLVRDNKITELPTSFSNLKRLEVLDLSFNTLKSLPLEFSDLNHLRVLKLDKTELKDTLSFNRVFELDSLVELSLALNNYASIPEEIGDLQLLERLTLNGNSLSELPAGFSNLTRLHTLDLSANLFQDSKKGGNGLDELAEMSSLRTLDLGSNKLMDFPIQDNWQKLTSLNLEYNRISHIEINSEVLYQLKYLNLQGNRELTELPEELGYLKSLESLDLSHTGILELPESIKELKKLKFLDLRDTPIGLAMEKQIQKMLPNTEIKFGIDATVQQYK